VALVVHYSAMALLVQILYLAQLHQQAVVQELVAVQVAMVVLAAMVVLVAVVQEIPLTESLVPEAVGIHLRPRLRKEIMAEAVLEHQLLAQAEVAVLARLEVMDQLQQAETAAQAHPVVFRVHQ
jgi:hypothetical protein